MAREKKALTGVCCYPSTTKFHAQERERGTAFAPGRAAYILKGADPEAYPPLVALEADDVIPAFHGDEGALVEGVVLTQHPIANKNLPDRVIVGFIDQDGTVTGEVPAKGVSLPQWELCQDDSGSFDLSMVEDAKARIASNKVAMEEARKAKKAAKKG